MSKIQLDNISGGYNLAKINDNFAKIEDALNLEVFYRDNPEDEPNALQTDLDANGKRVYNLPTPLLDNEAARLKDVQNAISGANAANLISFEPTEDIHSTNVQAAIEEVYDAIPTIPPPVPGGDGDGGAFISATKYMSAAQLAGVQGTGPLVDVIDALELAVADCGDITWQGSMPAQRPSAGDMKAGGAVIFPPGVYMISRTLYRPPHVEFIGQSGGGFFIPRPNSTTTANGNVTNVKGSLILANFPAGSGVDQAGQMWITSTANWEAGGVNRPAFNKTYSGALDVDTENVSKVPGGGYRNLWFDSVRNPATGLHIANQIPYGGIRLIAALNARVENVHIEGVDFGMLVNASWGFSVQNVFSYAYLGGMAMIDAVNAGKVTQAYFNRDTTLDSISPRTITNVNRYTGLVAGALNNASAGFPEDFTNMRIGCFVLYPNGLHIDSFTAEHWDIAKCVNQAPNAGLVFTNFYSEATSITPWACVGQVGTVSGFFDFSPGSRYGFCWGLNSNISLSGTLPRRLHVMPANIDPNRNIQVAVAKPDLYRNLGGGKSANMITWSNDVTQGRTLANMTTLGYKQSAADGSFTMGELTATGAGVASFVKSGANIAPITGTTIDFVNFGQNQPYCLSAELRAGTAPVTALQLAFTGGVAVTVKAVITWTAGVPSLVLSGDPSVTGFAEVLGNGNYKINVAGNCGNNTTMVATVFIGDGITVAPAGQTLYMGHHEVTPTTFPLQPIYNMSSTVPVSRNPAEAGYAESWEYRFGINYLGETSQRAVRVSASGNPYALGLDTGNLNTGTFTTLDSVLTRMAERPDVSWTVSILDGNTVPITANNNSIVQRDISVIFTKTGAGANPTIDVKANPFGQCSNILIEGDCQIELINVNVTMPTAGITDATAAGFVQFRSSRGASLKMHMAANTFNCQSNCAVFQQGANSASSVILSQVNGSVITGSGSARIHSPEVTPANSITLYHHMPRGGTGIGGSISAAIAATGWYNGGSVGNTTRYTVATA